MRGLDDPSLASLKDERTKLIVSLLSEIVFETPKITALLQAAGLSPGDYPTGIARLTWTEVVLDVAKRGELSELIACIVAEIPAFREALEQRLQPFLSSRTWYHHD